MEDAEVVVDPSEVELDPASAAFLESDDADKTTRVNVETLREFSQREAEGKEKRIVLRFLSSPVEVHGEGKVEKIVIGRNELAEEGGSLRARDSGEREELECGLVLRSVGYTGVPIEGVPFDEDRGLILNEGGRVLDSHDAGHKTGHYTAGWIKRGPSGVIGTNKKDALETVEHLLADVESGALLDPAEPRAGRGRGAARRARRPLRQLRGLAGDRPGRGRPRRAARPAAGQVRQRRGDARRPRREGLRLEPPFEEGDLVGRHPLEGLALEGGEMAPGVEPQFGAGDPARRSLPQLRGIDFVVRRDAVERRAADAARPALEPVRGFGHPARRRGRCASSSPVR